MARGRFATSTANSALPPRGEHPGSADRRDQILRAATEVISAVGFGETRITHIAARAGVAGGTIIYHFGTLDALLVEALRIGDEGFYVEAERRVAGGKNPRERLQRLVACVFEPDAANVQLWSLWLETWSHASRHPLVAQARSEQEARWRAMIAKAISSPSLKKSQVELFALGFGALVDGLIVQVALGDEKVGPDRAQRIAMAYATAMLGL